MKKHVRKREDCRRTALGKPEYDRWFEAFRAATAPALFEWFCRQLHNEDLAEDFTAETFFRFYRKGYSPTDDIPPVERLYTIAKNLCRDYGRKRKRRPAQKSLDAFVSRLSQQSGRDHTDAVESRDLIDYVLSRLPTPDEDIIRAHYIDGRSYKQIADDLGISVRAVTRRLARARAHFRVLLRP